MFEFVFCYKDIIFISISRSVRVFFVVSEFVNGWNEICFYHSSAERQSGDKRTGRISFELNNSMLCALKVNSIGGN